ncbi:MAG: transaldolase [Neisseria sp.]|nr:transaldolase [Neisseria sp.]
MNTIEQTRALGQQIWLDNLSRAMIAGGELAAKIAQGVSGQTTNPAIFLKAIQNDVSYHSQIATLQAAGHDAKNCYEILACQDVQAACDVFAEEHRRHGGDSGFVSIEVDPAFAHDAAQTVAEALRLHRHIARENVMIKVPATNAGITALQELVAHGVCVNMTLIFSRQTLQAIYRAWRSGIEQRLAQGLPIDAIRVVASVFLSRIDSALDERLPETLRGQIALALAKTAYVDWQSAANAALPVGAVMPSLLWASTGTKNPNYPDTLYVDNLIGAHTVNTLPEATLAAFLDHGSAAPRLAENTDAAAAIWQELPKHGIDFEAVAQELQNQGLAQFQAAFADILAALAN